MVRPAAPIRSSSPRRWTPGAAAVAALVLGLAPSSCVRVPIDRKLIEIHRYSIDPPVSKERADSSRALSLLVRPFQGNSSQAADRMLYSDDRHEMDFYFYNRWTVLPEKMVEDALVQDLMNWGFFRGGVYQGDAGIVPTHELQGRLVKLYADNRKGQPSAVFDASITVLRVDPKTYQREIIDQQDLPVTVARRNRELESFVEATNEAVRIWLEQVRSELDQLFRREARGPAGGPPPGPSVSIASPAASPRDGAPATVAPPDSAGTGHPPAGHGNSGVFPPAPGTSGAATP